MSVFRDLGLLSHPVSDFQRITVLGSGLLGGSVALAVAKRRPESSVILWGRNEERVTAIRSGGFPDVTSDLKRAVANADLVILAVPVGAMEDLGRDALDAGLRAGVCVTDVGSVKGHPHATVGELMAEQGHAFIGSHPMAGSEQTGFAAANPDLFEDAPCILTNEQERSEIELRSLRNFWESLGARTALMTAPDHDRLVARISHVPHVLSAVCALVALKNPGDGDYAGQGLRDTSRVGGGDPAMWTEILMENREQIEAPLRECGNILTELADYLRQGGADEILGLLTKGQIRRRLLD